MERIMDQKLNEAVGNIRLEFKKNLDDKIQDIEYSINNKVVTRLEMLERSQEAQVRAANVLENKIELENEKTLKIEETLKDHIDII